MAKRRYNPEAAKQDILEAAERLFAERGFAEVSTAEIARAAGLSQSQIHYHFETKRGLWDAVFQRRFGEYFIAQSEMLEAADVVGVERMADSIRAYFGFFRRNPRFVKLMMRARLDGVTESSDSMGAKLMQRGAEVVAAAQAAGELRSDVAPELVLIGFLSLVAHWFEIRDQLPPLGEEEIEARDDRYLEFILKVFLKGVSP